VSGLVRKGRLNFGTFSAKSCYCRDVFREVGLVPRPVRRGRVCVAVFNDVSLVSGRVRRGLVVVGTCPAMSDWCRDMSGEVGLMSGLVRLSRVIVGTCFARSA